jgi:DNA-3-methyladenine glycosylase
MVQNRHGRTGVETTNGPAKVCQALAIDQKWNGHNLRYEPFQLIMQPALDPGQIVQTARIGITKAVDVPWRFYIQDNPHVSKP